MHQLHGFVEPDKPSHVCLLRKALYGLKKAPRAWYQRFETYIISLGFVNSKNDTSLFVYRKGSEMAYLLLYVDDFVLASSSDFLKLRLISLLSSKFAMTDLGPLTYFLGISVSRTKSGMFLSQRQYAHDILSRVDMSSCKPATTFVNTKSKLSTGSGPPISDPTLYRQLAGALQYLTFTRPYITYIVQHICLFMHDPREHHLHALRRVLRYIKGTIDYGMHLAASSTTGLISYTDVDWGGCPDTRRSTSGYCDFLGDNLVSCHGPQNAKPPYLVQHQRTKHVEMDIHFVREKVALGHIRVLHVPSAYQYTDILRRVSPALCSTIFAPV
ncbi:uncharacterized protein LOC110687690 [Chenopodium quinoa]|uniref:uncharacterized protein LOC110687690 n=1 Tax=Chenopodium quinoa TaxID=63459 RepID=UPI000B770534|nr:uncharacterized protein LOC110687690 [Chenopodium quinoa]